MTTIYSLSPALIGIFIVVQAGFNRRISAVEGLPFAFLLNAIVFLVGAAIYYFLSEQKAPVDFKNFSLWYLVPGICGMGIVLGGPWALSRFGAVHTFSLVISAQLAASLLWDLTIEKSPISIVRSVGVAVTWLGVMIAIRG